ncbi:hypothetical protein Ciccas_002344 [Cichlidogyrus casuarinus]|uniref:RING-type domain-containing protein n=1 Tax=Cichlidogyrus casuarinus TaxID=1844966 RepID=A0ABD2QIG9_9PLAT
MATNNEPDDKLFEVDIEKVKEDFFNCIVCFQSYDTEDRLPKLLPCKCNQIICNGCINDLKTKEDLDDVILALQLEQIKTSDDDKPKIHDLLRETFYEILTFIREETKPESPFYKEELKNESGISEAKAIIMSIFEDIFKKVRTYEANAEMRMATEKSLLEKIRILEETLKEKEVIIESLKLDQSSQARSNIIRPRIDDYKLEEQDVIDEEILLE